MSIAEVVPLLITVLVLLADVLKLERHLHDLAKTQGARLPARLVGELSAVGEVLLDELLKGLRVFFVEGALELV